MNASSQTQPTARPAQAPAAPRPLPLSEALAAVPTQTSPVQSAAAAVLAAEMQAEGGATGEQLAAAERRAGILFDAASVEAAVSAARAQACAEYAAELDDLREQLAVLGGAYRQRQAVLRLCEGHRGDDMLLVSAVAVAAECGTTALDGLPMTLTWTRSAQVPEAGDSQPRVVVECTSSYGGRADLVVDGDDRQALASLLDAELVRDVHAPCPTDGCGTADDYDASDPSLFGWTRLEVAGTDDTPRWYCSSPCVWKALARAGEELAAADQLAAVDPDEPVPFLDARYGPGTSDEYTAQQAEATADDAALDAEDGDQ